MLSILLYSILSFAQPQLITHLSEAPTRLHEKGGVVKFLVDKDHGAKNGFMAILTVPPSGKVPEHRDESEEYLYVLEGEGTIWIEDKSYKIKKDDAVFMPANAKVKFEAGPKQMVKVLQVFAPQGSEEKYQKWKVK